MKNIVSSRISSWLNKQTFQLVLSAWESWFMSVITVAEMERKMIEKSVRH
jgi:hypothetical protein